MGGFRYLVGRPPLHELATPLTTIAVVSKEIELELKRHHFSDAIISDFTVIQEELERCRGILDQMSNEAGHLTVETPTTIEVEPLVRQVMAGLSRVSGEVNLQLSEEARSATVKVPLQSFGMALRGIVQNALDASPDDPVDLIVSVDSDLLCIVVRDCGPGMTQEILQRADEPFYSTKEAGKGMGLGEVSGQIGVRAIGRLFRD